MPSCHAGVYLPGMYLPAQRGWGPYQTTRERRRSRLLYCVWSFSSLKAGPSPARAAGATVGSGRSRLWGPSARDAGWGTGRRRGPSVCESPRARRPARRGRPFYGGASHITAGPAREPLQTETHGEVGEGGGVSGQWQIVRRGSNITPVLHPPCFLPLGSWCGGARAAVRVGRRGRHGVG